MLFPTVTFAVFLVVVLTASWALYRRPVAWKLFMIAASYVFYGAWDHRFTMLLAVSTLLNHSVAQALAVQRRGRHLTLAVGVAANVGLLGYFKYFDFFTVSVINGLRSFGVTLNPPLVEVLLPVGISFYTFMGLSYIIDVYRRQLVPSNLLDFALYLSFFPHLVAGPIVRGGELLPQLRRPLARDVDSARAFQLIARGLFKKVVIATYVSTALVDGVFTSPASFSSLDVLFGIYGYAVQIYADFSGYTDIAIGLALLLGFEFPLNFDRPYAASSLREFWQRWHITLSRWLRDYLYIPLGGNRGGRVAAGATVLATMVLGGLWHGAAWTFVVWGAIHGVGLVVERALPVRGLPDQGSARLRTGVLPPGPRIVGRVVTFHIVCLGWVFFRAESFSLALDVLARLFTAPGPVQQLTTTFVAVVVASVAVQQFGAWPTAQVESAFSKAPLSVQAVTLALILFAIALLKPAGVAPFIYFRF